MEYVTISDELLIELRKGVLKDMMERYQSGALVSEADFLSGVTSTVLHLLGERHQNTMSFGADWVFMIMGSRSVVAYELEKQGKEQMARDAQAKTARDARVRMHSDELVDFVKLAYAQCKPRIRNDREVLQGLFDHAAALLDDLDMWPPEDMED